MTDGLSYVHGVSDVPLIGETVGAHFQRAAARWPDRPALIVREQAIRWTYAELDAQVDAFAAGLLALGLEPGDRVGIWSPNNAEWVVTQFATAKAGLILVNINPAYRTHELDYALNKVGCRALVTASSFKTSDYLAMLRELAPELATAHPGQLRSARLPRLETVIQIGGAGPGTIPFAEIAALGTGTQRARLVELADQLQFDEPINIQFTSGTTGAPKGATLTHHNILNNGFFIGEAQKLGPDDKVCIPVPLYHCFGMVLGNLACITHGSAMVYPGGGFDPLAVLQTVHEERCTALYGVPTMFIAELGHPEFQSLRPFLPAHRHHGGLALPDRGHAPRRRRDAHGRGHHRLRHDRDQPGELPELDRRSARPPRLHRRPHPPPPRGQDRRRRRAASSRAAPPASCAPAATR